MVLAPGDAPLTGEEAVSRLAVTGSGSMVDGQLRLVYFRAHRSETITKALATCTTAAGATPTLIRYGVYSVAMSAGLPAGDLTLIASTPNDTTMLAAAATEYEKAFTASWNKVAGTWYAAGLLVKTAASTPSIAGISVTTAVLVAGGKGRPRLAAISAGQTDLPATITAASLSNTGFVPYLLLEQ